MPSLPKGLFTKELEVALLKGHADLAVHSLKDLPTELPAGLKLGAVAGKRADVRDVLIYKEPLAPGLKLAQLPKGLTVATSSTRRQAQLLAARPDFKVVEIRGNVATRLRKLAEQAGNWTRRFWPRPVWSGCSSTLTIGRTADRGAKCRTACWR